MFLVIVRLIVFEVFRMNSTSFTFRLFRSLLSLFFLVYIVCGLPSLALALILAFAGETGGGRLFGWGVIILFPVPIMLWISLYGRKVNVIRLVGSVLLCLSLLLFGICYSISPAGRPDSDANVAVLHKAPHPGEAADSHARFSPANMVPEIDQLKLGTYVFPALDPFIDREQGIRVRRLFIDLYRDMRQSDDFNELGSALGYCYRDLFTGKRTRTHSYEYIPETEGELPVILFLHGSLGNFKGYLWFWKKFADEHGYAIVAPTFGAGNWYLEGGVLAVEHMREYCIAHPRMDGNRVYLAGLSNGGTGVTRAARKNPSAYVGLIYLSAIIEPNIISDRRYMDGWEGRDVLVLHGAADRRIPEDYVHQAVTSMTINKVTVTSKFYPEEDHFLLFSKPDEMRSDIADWIDSIE